MHCRFRAQAGRFGTQAKDSMTITKLLDPITMKGTVIKNRIVMPAMALFYTDDYTFNHRCKAFYRERAVGGVGLMIMGPMAIDRIGGHPFLPGLFDDSFIGPIRAFARELHRESDVRIGVQLMHVGRYAPSVHTGNTSIAPSTLAGKATGEVPRAMTKDDIETIQKLSRPLPCVPGKQGWTTWRS